MQRYPKRITHRRMVGLAVRSVLDHGDLGSRAGAIKGKESAMSGECWAQPWQAAASNQPAATISSSFVALNGCGTLTRRPISHGSL
jgi:hypothetical protein